MVTKNEIIDGLSFTRSTIPLIPADLERLSRALSVLGIDQARVGLELEFTPSSVPEDNSTEWEKAKARALSDLEAQIAAAPASQKPDLETRKAEIADFGVREMLMYEILEDDARNEKLLEPLFGKSHDGNGYYDADNTLELKIAHCDVRDIVRTRKTVLRALIDKAELFGIPLECPPNYHVNLSFWKNGQNLFDPAHPEFRTTGRAIVEGITPALYEASPLLLESDLDATYLNLDVSVNRETFMRTAFGRYEIRHMGYRQNPDLLTTIALAGAAHGLKSASDPAIHRASVVKVPVIKRNTPDTKILSHVLGNAEVRKDNSVEIPEGYAETKLPQLAFELGLWNRPRAFEIYASSLIDPKQHPITAPILRFLKAIRIDAKAGKILWPETEPGAYISYTEVIGAERLPPKIQERLYHGQELTYEENHKYVGWGGTVPKARKQIRIDTAKLNEALTLNGCSERLVIRPGYDLDACEQGLPRKGSRIFRMIGSAPLEEYLSTALMDEIRGCAISLLAERQAGPSASCRTNNHAPPKRIIKPEA